VRVSVGLVLDAETSRRVDVPAREMLRWGLSRCPFARELTRSAALPEHNRVAADFTYTCRPYAGPGYFLIGDAATFLDPVFSTGVCLGMKSAASAAQAATRLLVGKENPAEVRREYARDLDKVSSTLFRLIRRYYSHSFRELFLHGQGPFEIHRAVIAALTGDVFPRPRFSMRWRLLLFDLFVEIQRRVELAPRREVFSLLEDRDLA
jgi:flavin-dependent dehydrogenase